jgi:dTDP-4-amino-4,6-dideoxygalactose transaminase
MRKKIKLFDPVVGDEESRLVQKVLLSGFWASGSGVGDVKKFEDSFQKYIGCKSCVAVNNGTAALHLALSACNIKNKEVLLPSLSFISTAHAVVYNGGKPVFVDVDPDTLCMDPEDAKRKITKKTAAVLPVHFGGMGSDLDRLTKICKKSKIPLVEDAAHACGTTVNGQRIGKHGNFVCFSFHPVKNLAMPSGGLVAINQPDHKNLREKLASMRWCGITNRKGVFYDVKEIGWNFYMNEFSAVIGLAQLKRLDKVNDVRRKIAKRYSNEINLEMKMPFDVGCSYHFYWIRVNNRSEFMKKMDANYVETGIHYKPIHSISMYKTKTGLPVTDSVGQQIVTLPIHPNLSENDIDMIIRLTNKFAC